MTPVVGLVDDKDPGSVTTAKAGGGADAGESASTAASSVQVIVAELDRLNGSTFMLTYCGAYR